MTDEWLKGRLLLALPNVRDDPFFRTVILVLAHGPQGALGVVLNRPTRLPVDELFPDLALSAASPKVLFDGGPLEPNGIICLAQTTSPEEREGFAPILDRWGSIHPHEPPEGGVGVENVRVYRGYAGWVPRQLESELRRASWLVLDVAPDDLTTDEPDGLWETILDRHGPRYSRIKAVPRDPSLN